MSNPSFEAYAAAHLARTGRVWKGTPSQYFTNGDQEEGYPATREALQGLDDAQLNAEYSRNIRGCFGMFRNAARRYLNLIEEEILTRPSLVEGMKNQELEGPAGPSAPGTDQ